MSLPALAALAWLAAGPARAGAGTEAADRALALREEGREEEAAALWLEAARASPEDPFLWSQLGWSRLAAGHAREAAQAFESAVRASSATYSAAEAQLGLGLALARDGKSKPAIAALQAAATRSPSVLPAASAELARLAEESGHREQAIPLYAMALEADPRQLDPLRELALAYERLGLRRQAWGAWRAAAEFDPADARALRGMQESARRLTLKPEALLSASRRLSRPMMRSPRPAPASPVLRVALFTDDAGDPRELRRLYLIPSTDARVTEEGSEEPLLLKSDSQWELVFLPELGGLELRDGAGKVRRATKRALRMSPSFGGTLLLKSLELCQPGSADARDRELRGEVEIAPSSSGLRLANLVGVEEYVVGQLGAAMPPDSPSEAMKAMAVLLRSRALALSASRYHLGRPSLCDSRHCALYLGLAQETAAAAAATRQTRSLALRPLAGELAHTESCGWASAEGRQDRASAAAGLGSALVLERILRSPPDPGHFDGAAERVLPGSSARWLLVLPARALAERMDRVRPLGPLRSVRVAARDAGGRATALEVEGARARARLEGHEAIASLLSPGALRSDLFTLQPMSRGGSLERLLVWGGGTGDGRGLCRAGAIGQARLGRGFREILSHYFPAAALPAEPKSAFPTPRQPAPGP